MESQAARFQLLGDAARLRLLRVLSRERLNVSELTGILGLAQSGVSRHLKLLKDAGFIEEQRYSGFTYHSLADSQKQVLGPLWNALADQFARAADDPKVKADDARLQEVLRVRQENSLDHAVDAQDNRQLVPGRSWAAWSRALALLLPRLRVADLGCGEGYLTIEASRWASSVVAIDRSPAVLARARELGKRRRATNVTWKAGELEHLPIKTSSVDVALFSQALHHAVDPAIAIGEAVRILVPGGRVLVLDLREHDETWVREKLGDQTLGFSEDHLRRLLIGGGLEDVQTSVGARKAGGPFSVLIAVGHKPLRSTTQSRARRKAS